jgi:hypothetical protein
MATPRQRSLTAAAVAACLALAAAGPAMAGPGGTRVLATAGGVVRFAVDVPPLQLEPLTVDGLPAAVGLRLDGYDDTGVPGEPGLPSRIVHVAVPPSGEVRVRAESFDDEVRSSVVAAPVPWQEDGSLRRAPSPEAYARVAPYGGAAGRARLLDVSWMRDQRVARIAVEPVSYDAPARTVRAARRIEVTVETAGDAAAVTPRESGEPFEPVYRGALVNYDQGLAWRRPGGAAAAVRDRADEAAAGETSVFAGRRWLRIAIARSGFHRLRYGTFRRLAPFLDQPGLVLDSLRLVTLPGLPLLSEQSFCDTCDYREVAIAVTDAGNDGLLSDNEDAIVFFASGPNGWFDEFDSSLPDTAYLNHPYETRNYYFLGLSTADRPIPGPRRRMATRSASVQIDGGETTPATFEGRVHEELDASYVPDAAPIAGSNLFWSKWYWKKLTSGLFPVAIDLPGADTTASARLRARVWSLPKYPPCAEALRQTTVTARWQGGSLGTRSWTNFLGFTFDVAVSPLRTRGNGFEIGPTLLRCGNDLGIDWVDVFYPRRFAPEGEKLDFRSPGAGNFIYRVEPFAGATPPRVYDVTDPLAPVELLGLSYEALGAGAGHRLSFETSETSRRRYLAVPDTSVVMLTAANVAEASESSLDDLRSPDRGADYIVVSYDGFLAAADSLAAWRRAFRGWECEVIPVTAIYDQFSGGRTDPAAIRAFLRAAYRSWRKVPTYVTFLGDASYDFKNLTGSAPAGQPGTLLPTYENGFDAGVLRQFTTDDWLLNVDDPVRVVPDFLGGRIPAPDAASALDIVRNKVLFYERAAPPGEYRNRVVFVADDNEQAGIADPLEWQHLRQTTMLDTLRTPFHMDRHYVYLHTYPGWPTEIAEATGAAKRDLFERLNGAGAAMVNYIGHGSPFKITDEGVMLDNDVGALVNAERLPVFFAASCDVGKFNDPDIPSLGERLLVRSGGGAIAVISATELAYSGQNAALNDSIYLALFSRGAAGAYDGLLSAALLTGKLGSTNSQKYQLMGDAAQFVNLPRLTVMVQLARAAGGADSVMRQGETMLVSGRVVRSPADTTTVPYDGVVSLLIEDSAPLDQAPPCRLNNGVCSPFPGRPRYYFSPGPIYRGDVAVTGGRFSTRFVVPIEARPGGRARARAYFAGGPDASPVDGAGSARLRVGAGTGPGDDQEGPRITLGFPNNATTVKPDAVLRVDLSDPSGILITGHTLQNGIVVTLDDNSTNRIDITERFRYDANSYQSGSADFPLERPGQPALAEGPHRITVSAADNLAAGLDAGRHRSQATIEFVVSRAPPLRILNAYLFPNPTRSKGAYSGGRFVVDTEGDAVNLLLRIYTSSGRLIRTLRSLGGSGQVQIPWDGLDDEGQGLANGLYLFKVHANVRAADGSSSPSQSAQAEGRIVVLN